MPHAHTQKREHEQSSKRETSSRGVREWGCVACVEGVVATERVALLCCDVLIFSSDASVAAARRELPAAAAGASRQQGAAPSHAHWQQGAAPSHAHWQPS